jgi:atypical dual specificity phosphatase
MLIVAELCALWDRLAASHDGPRARVPFELGGNSGADAATVVSMPRNFSWVTAGGVAGASIPKRSEQIAALSEMGITIVLTLCEEQPLPAGLFENAMQRQSGGGGGKKNGHCENQPVNDGDNDNDNDGYAGCSIANIFVPVPNFKPPTVAQMDHCAALITSAVLAGGAALVHCGGGKGRAGTVLACWAHHSRAYVEGEGCGVGDASGVGGGRGVVGGRGGVLSLLNGGVPLPSPNTPSGAVVAWIRQVRPGSIETTIQEEFVRAYAAHVRPRHDAIEAAAEGDPSSGESGSGDPTLGGYPSTMHLPFSPGLGTGDKVVPQADLTAALKEP